MYKYYVDAICNEVSVLSPWDGLKLSLEWNCSLLLSFPVMISPDTNTHFALHACGDGAAGLSDWFAFTSGSTLAEEDLMACIYTAVYLKHFLYEKRSHVMPAKHMCSRVFILKCLPYLHLCADMLVYLRPHSPRATKGIDEKRVECSGCMLVVSVVRLCMRLHLFFFFINLWC